jgi:hypothetical protein
MVRISLQPIGMGTTKILMEQNLLKIKYITFFMKMPETLDSKLLAPCGINCISCERYQNPCAGCLISDDGKNKASLKCKIKACFDKKNFNYCGRCSEFPCPMLKKHSKKYVKRHNMNTLNSAKRIKTMGIGRMMSEDRERWMCPECGGVVKFQTGTCSECRNKMGVSDIS